MSKPNMARERAFEKELAHIAAIHKCAYIKIPDPLITAYKLSNKKDTICKEERRPFDGILVLPYGNICVECKYNYNKTSKHQQEYLDTVNKINGGAIVLRKIERFDNSGYRRTSVKYVISKNDNIIYETDRSMDLMGYMIKNNICETVEEYDDTSNGTPQ